MTKKIPFIIVIILVVAVAILAVVFLFPEKGGEELEKEEKIEEGVEPEKEAPIIAEEIYGISGEIKEVFLDKILSVEANILLADLEKEPIKQVVRIRVTDETKILKLKFPEEIPEGSTELISPEETEISYNDLKVGDIIDIETTGNVSENIKNKTEITASTINVVE